MSESDGQPIGAATMMEDSRKSTDRIDVEAWDCCAGIPLVLARMCLIASNYCLSD